ncbi:hypothetical protein A3Q56_06137 [Intoshia linei]|uniref:3'-5' exonuclease domain-containing protein n=1 Tax=Intoshia linei TaxID=1819745 RepID=A0A177AWC5_9BILA|nr:hypothetical protein A3Q56_06137 [Intoshia linei]
MPDKIVVNSKEIITYQNKLNQEIQKMITTFIKMRENTKEYDHICTLPIFKNHCNKLGIILTSKFEKILKFHFDKLTIEDETVENSSKIIEEFNKEVCEKLLVKFYQFQLDEKLATKKVEKKSNSGHSRTSRQIQRGINWKKYQTSSNVEKTKIDVDNSENEFIHKIKVKPHFIEPLSIWEKEIAEKKIGPFRSPFKVEIDNLNHDTFNAFNLSATHYIDKIETNIETTLSNTPFLFVETVDQLEIMVQEIYNIKTPIISVDLEHHNFRSYLGFTCLIQISTVDKDYVIDAIKLRPHLAVLNNFTTNPNVLKIFHACNADILWLQKDFGVFVVNNVDTSIMALGMGYDKISYSNLMKLCFKVTIDKDLQLADWRLRPLPEVYITYARLDTHYLFWLYEFLRVECLKIGPRLGISVLIQSRKLSLDMYRKNEYNPTFHHKYSKLGLIAKNSLYYIIKWRDEVARELDESAQYIFTNKVCVNLATNYFRYHHGTSLCPHIDIKYELKLKQYLSKLKDNKFVLDEPNLPNNIHKKTINISTDKQTFKVSE